MSIEARGNNNTLVLTDSAVPIADIAEAIIDGYDIDWLCERFPVKQHEVFEVIDAVADMMDESYSNNISLKNLGDAANIDLETTSVSDSMFFNLVNYGRAANSTELDFNKLFSIGLKSVIIDIYRDLKNNVNHYENSAVHEAVFKALKKVVGDADPNQILANLLKNKED